MTGILIFIMFLDFETHAEYIPESPFLDGYIEEIWHKADSITSFTQQFPDEGKPSNYKTTLYILYTESSIYFAFKCEQEDVYAVVDLWDRGRGDGVGIYLDTFGDKKTAYYFFINAKGVQSDGIISEDGREKDMSWDGIWRAVAKIYDRGYVIEVEIPFKTIRYAENLSEWGCNFMRFVYKDAESSYWVPVKRNEGLRVSKFGILKGVNPEVKGRFFEAYPVGILRHDRIIDENPETSPKAGLDLAWNPTSQISLNATFFPDFGEIEADPYVLNLSKYATYYKDRRPFFIEGTELFKFPPEREINIGSGYHLFYTRRIGRKLSSGKEVPISAGAKFLSKTKDFETGFIFTRCERTEDEEEVEPLSYFQVLRIKKHLFGNSDIGFLYAGKDEIRPYYYERVLGLDLNLRDIQNDAKVIFARSFEKNKNKEDFLFDASFMHVGEKFIAFGSAQTIGDSFDLNEVGYVPGYGTKSVGLVFGPNIYPEKYLYRFGWFVGAGFIKEFGERKFSGGFTNNFEITFKNWWELNGGMNLSREYENGKFYNAFNFNFGFHTDWRKPFDLGLWSGRYFGYYDEDEYMPYYVYWSNFYTGYKPLSSMEIEFSLNASVLTEEEDIKNYYIIPSPRFWWSISRNLKFSIYTEGVYTKEDKRFIQIRFGGILSFMIAPKSWFYIAINDLEGYEGNKYLPYERVYVAKLRYLFYF